MIHLTDGQAGGGENASPLILKPLTVECGGLAIDTFHLSVHNIVSCRDALKLST